MVIQAKDRVDRVLEADESLIDVFVAASPHFERLRNPAMRRVMARLVTVEQAARIAKVPADTLVQRLNAAAAGAQPKPVIAHSSPVDGEASSTPPPAAIAGVTSDRILDVDVRDDLRKGQEPFARIMAAKRQLPWGHVLRLRAIFEPAPLYLVLGKQGFAHWTEQLAEDDWRVWFYRPVEGAAASTNPNPGDGSAPVAIAAAQAEDEDVFLLDVRGLEPPEPLVRTLAALQTLPVGSTLVQLNVRTPRFLLPKLDELGFEYEVREQGSDLVRLFVRHRAG